MKKTTIVLSLFALAAVSSCKEKATEKINSENLEMAAERDEASKDVPVMTFQSYEHDFGNILQGQPQETSFAFTNTGTAPLIITSTSASCGCTVPDAPVNQPIAPGDSGEIKVKFNGTGNGQVAKTVTIRANTAAGSELLRIKAFINPNTGPLQAGPVK